jgi:hypothetical protein
MESSPGWIVAIVLAGTGLAVVAVIGVVRASARKTRERRSRALAEALTARGFTTAECEAIPDDMPDWEIAPRRKRPGTAIRVEGTDAVLWLFDHVHDKGYTGWNEENRPGGESGPTTEYPHTLACLHSATLTLPEFQVIPNLRQTMEGITAGVARSVEAEGHALPGGALDMLLGVVGGLMAARERPGAIALTDLPELAAACKLYGENASAVRALATGPLGDLLRARPGVILEGRGPWLIVSVNVGITYGFDPEGTAKPERGLLTPERASELVEQSFEIATCLGSRIGG